VLFAKPRMAGMGTTEAECTAKAARVNMGASVGAVLLCGLFSAWALAVVISGLGATTAFAGASIGALDWPHFAGATCFGTSLFSLEKRGLWMINTAYNLVALVIAGIVLALWR
jgi:hypothetical protein